MVNLTLKNNPLMCQCFNGFIKPAEPNFYLEVYLPNQKREWECNFVLGMSILHLSTIFLVDFGTVPTAWYPTHVSGLVNTLQDKNWVQLVL
jgi:hypothetical protein